MLAALLFASFQFMLCFSGKNHYSRNGGKLESDSHSRGSESSVRERGRTEYSRVSELINDLRQAVMCTEEKMPMGYEEFFWFFCLNSPPESDVRNRYCQSFIR